MSATWTPLDRNTHALRLAGARLTWYRLAGDVRSLTIQRAVVDHPDLGHVLRLAQAREAGIDGAACAGVRGSSGESVVSGVGCWREAR